MAAQVALSEDGRYVLVTQTGPVISAHIKDSRAEALPLFIDCDRALVDFRLADLSHLNVLELDDLGAEFRQDVPRCIRMALVRAPGIGTRAYTHLVNVHCIYGIQTQLFEDMDVAKAWLLSESDST